MADSQKTHPEAKTDGTPTIIDSQSVLTAEGGEQHGYDAGKQRRPPTDQGRRRPKAVANGTSPSIPLVC